MSPTIEQSMDALQIANRRRFARAVIKHELRDAQTKEQALALCADHIEDPDPVLAKCSAFDLIKACHRCAETTSLATLRAAGVSVNVKIGQPGETAQGWLTDDQRERLVAVLRDPAGAPRRNNHFRLGPVNAPPKPAPAAPVVLVEEPIDAVCPSLATWCPRCADYAIALRDGTCGFCYTQIADPEAA